MQASIPTRLSRVLVTPSENARRGLNLTTSHTLSLQPAVPFPFVLSGLNLTGH